MLYVNKLKSIIRFIPPANLRLFKYILTFTMIIQSVDLFSGIARKVSEPMWTSIPLYEVGDHFWKNVETCVTYHTG